MEEIQEQSIKKIPAPRDPILILEDAPDNRMLLENLCRKMDLPCVTAENGEAGLKLLAGQKFSIYIVDLLMPVMTGREFISSLKEIEPEAVILVQSALNSADEIIDVMKLGIFDYIVKPIDPELFAKNIYKSLEFKYLRDTEKILTESASLKIRNQLTWLNYKEEIRVSAREYSEIKSIFNLKDSLTQGASFGSLITLINIIKNNHKIVNDNVIINKKLVDLLIEYNSNCSSQLNGLHSISSLLEDLFPVMESSAAAFIGAIPGILKEITRHFPLKNLSITYPTLKTNCALNLNMEKLSLIIEEIVINAFKYSIDGSSVNIFSYVKEGYFWLSVMNEVGEKPDAGIPQKFEKLVLEPFFRLQPVVETIGNVEKFGLGLGLTVVDNIARKHGGMFMIHDVKDHTEGRLRQCVLAELLLPVIN